MALTLPLAESTAVGSPALNIGIFAAFVVFTLVIVIKVASGKKTAEQYYTAGGAFTGRQNGIAIAGDYLSAASFLGIAGAIALQGYDGFLYSIGFLVAWLVALLLVAELLRNTGLVSLLLGVNGDLAQNLVIALVGVIMIAYVLIGGMKGTTWVQIIKALLLIAGTFIITVWVLGKYSFNISSLFQAAADNSPAGDKLFEPGLKYGKSLTTKIDFISLSMALVLGTAGLPHVLQRFYTVPTSKQARKSVEWAIWLIGGFYLLTLVVGYGAAALVGPTAITSAPGKANSAAPLLAYELGGSVLLGIISGIAFATILAVVAGLTITTSATFAHDLYKEVFKRGVTTQDQEVRVARLAAIVIGAVAIVGGIFALGQNIAFLVAYGGLISAIVLIIFSPVVSGKAPAVAGGPSPSMITDPSIDFHLFPLDNPGLISIPLAFFLGWLGSVTSKEYNAQKYAEMEVRSLTGHGVGEAVEH